MISSWQDARAAGNWQQVWEQGRRLLRDHSEAATKARVFLCLEIISAPAAEVWVDGALAGQTPYVHRYQPGEQAAFFIHAAGHQPRQHTLQSLSDRWQWDASGAPLSELQRVIHLDAPIRHSSAAEPSVQATLADGQLVRLTAGEAPLSSKLGDRDRVDSTHSVDQPAVYRTATLVLTANDLYAVESRTGLPLWHHHGFDRSALGLAISEHELIDGDGKAWVTDGESRIHAFHLRGESMTRLAVTPLPGRATAPPAAILIDTALSAVIQPCGTRLAVFNGQ